MADGGQSLEISGGTLYVNADGDGLDSNGSLTISGGVTVVDGPTNSGNGALDANGEIIVTGGTLTAVGSSGMAETPGTNSTQGWLAFTVSSGLAAGTQVQIVAEDGTVVATFTPAKQAASVVFSDAALADGGQYSLVVGGQTVATTTEGASDAGGGMGGGGGGRGGR